MYSSKRSALASIPVRLAKYTFRGYWLSFKAPKNRKNLTASGSQSKRWQISTKFFKFYRKRAVINRSYILLRLILSCVRYKEWISLLTNSIECSKTAMMWAKSISHSKSTLRSIYSLKSSLSMSRGIFSCLVDSLTISELNWKRMAVIFRTQKHICMLKLRRSWGSQTSQCQKR